MRITNTLVALLFFMLSPVLAQQAADSIEPEAQSSAQTSGFSEVAEASLAAKRAGLPVTSDNWMVVAANPLAVEAGASILREGGTAADAMVAVQAVLGLVEPQSSGLGGGAFLVWYDAASGALTTLDGRETAPLAATPKLFQNANGEPLKFFDAVVGGLSVGAPGTPMLMEEAHGRWGSLEWQRLFDSAISLADNGFAVSPRLASLVARDAERLSRFETTRNYFVPDGGPITEGAVLTNAAYAQTLRAISEGGAETFYSGEIAQSIVDTVQQAPGNPGVLSLTDLAIYRVKERPAVCIEYRTYDVCGMGPPSSGALTVGQILGIIENFGIAQIGPDDPDVWRLIGDASRLAFADRGRYMADSDFVPVPTKGLLDKDYLRERAELIEGDRIDQFKALSEVAPGAPAFDHAMLRWADDESLELPSTSHISIVDQFGNALSMTTTIENGFGSRLMSGGFLLNNELTDFSFRSHSDGVPIANRVEPGKRPRSSMSPTIVMRNGAPYLVVGSPGGSRIIGYVAQAIVGVLDWGLDVQSAVAMPHRVNRFGTFDLEAETSAAADQSALEAMGYEVNVRSLTSGLHAILIEGDTLIGGADPRREGIAIGE
ncbi:MAG: gamma-glutamyltransferase [Pseudomonadota bacterium]